MGCGDSIELHHSFAHGDSLKDSNPPQKPQTKPEKQKSTNRATVKGGPAPDRKPYLGENLVALACFTKSFSAYSQRFFLYFRSHPRRSTKDGHDEHSKRSHPNE
jgi:hypothetical protein